MPSFTDVVETGEPPPRGEDPTTTPAIPMLRCLEPRMQEQWSANASCMADASWGVYCSVLLVSLPAHGSCSCKSLHTRAFKATNKVGMLVARRHGFLRGFPLPEVSPKAAVKLGKDKVKLIHEFLDSWPVPMSTVFRPFECNGTPRPGNFSRNFDIGIPNFLECRKMLAQVRFSTGFLAVYLLPGTSAGAGNGAPPATCTVPWPPSKLSKDLLWW